MPKTYCRLYVSLRGSQWRLVAFAAVLLLAPGAWTRLAVAETLNFSDLGPACSPFVPSPYQGLLWSANFQLECNSDYASSYGNSYGASSGYAATNGSISSGVSEVSIGAGTFDFVGADFSSFAGADAFQYFSAESLQIYAYRPGDSIDNPTFIATLDLDPTQYVTTTFDWTGIDALFFGAGTGPASDPGTIFGVDGLSWLITNMQVNLTSGVPEPASMLLFGTALAACAFMRRRAAGRNISKVKRRLMTTSLKTKIALVFAAPLLLASVRSASAQTIAIQSAVANSMQTTLSIAGSNFCASPVVTLGGTALSVQSSTPALITASLPALAPSTYYLVVSCGTLAGRTAYFDVTIGPQAPTASGGCWVTGQRYADCGNGTVTDSATGLIWLKNADCATLGTVDYANANTAAAGLHSGQCGLTDSSVAGQWRLPTRTEWLATLAGPQGLIAQYASATCSGPILRANDGVTCYSAAAPGSAAGEHAFLNVVTGGYWSSSTYELDPTYSYLADLSVANLSNDNATLPHFQGGSLTLNVWPVRNGAK